MNEIYLLKSNVADYSSFLEGPCKESIISLSMDQKWTPFITAPSVGVVLRKSDTLMLNYKFDISGSLRPFFIISENTLKVLGDILLPRGQLIDVNTPSKKKKFFGYYPTNPIKNCFDKELSTYDVGKHGLMIHTPVLIKNHITDDYLFSVEEDIHRVFVTSAFKKLVEDSGLLGFDFSHVITMS